ncbi:Na-translocating system protein MpsC family protein [Mesobacillus selenatarsenatis]|uniref:DUF2294 family protein n=1 Tax=Mesobacillus selenatarsenatis TaxID=388741 RepID=A0A846TZ51_9BACI|nr:Na-translocating system protein MpsC family protein [Mesobacillus selenatarsenatis]NKE07661.1 DUF2294 family protein [Mesobacillus selenatarsenatis]
MDLRNKEKDLGSYIGRILREHFGKGPGSVFATIAHPYITVYIKDFLSPMEDKLMTNEQSKYVEKIRDMLMQTLTEEIKAFLKMNLDINLNEFHYDWNLDSHTGMFIGVMESQMDEQECFYRNQDEVHDEIIKVSIKAEKPPGSITSCMLNPRTLVIIRNEILISVEKEMINLGFTEALTLAKRNLEKRLLKQHTPQLETYLEAKVENAFVSWDFELDKSLVVLILKPNS